MEAAVKKPKPVPSITLTISAPQSLTSALRLKLGWSISITLPKPVAPIKTVKRPMWPRGKNSAEKAIRWTGLSLPDARGG